MKLSEVKVGDVVVLCSRNFAPRKVKVIKVGRQYIYTSFGKTGFSKEAGQANDGYNHEWLMTLEEHQKWVEVDEARKWFQDRGFGSTHTVDPLLLLEIVRRMST